MPAFRAIGELRDAAQAPVMVVHHLNKSGGYSGSRAIMGRADLIFEGSDGDTPLYQTRGRSLRRDDRILQPFSVNVAHENDSDDTIAVTRVAANFDVSSGRKAR
jgi:hypothetical protein